MNIPNILSALRIMMVPAFLYFYFGNNLTISFWIVLLAGLTDTLDGQIARRCNLITDLGIVLDPIADKLMLVAVIGSLTIKGTIPPWILLVVVVKESMMALGAIMLHRKHEVVVPANRYGKAATIAFYIAVVAVALHSKFYMLFMVLFMLLTLFALFIYSGYYRDIRNDAKQKVE